MLLFGPIGILAMYIFQPQFVSELRYPIKHPSLFNVTSCQNLKPPSTTAFFIGLPGPASSRYGDACQPPCSSSLRWTKACHAHLSEPLGLRIHDPKWERCPQSHSQKSLPGPSRVHHGNSLSMSPKLRLFTRSTPIKTGRKESYSESSHGKWLLKEDQFLLGIYGLRIRFDLLHSKTHVIYKRLYLLCILCCYLYGYLAWELMKQTAQAVLADSDGSSGCYIHQEKCPQK